MVDIVVGIDLGTTNSEVAALIDGNPQVIAAPDGEQIMPSCVGLGADGTFLVGTPARNQYVLYPERTIRSIKRLMGTDERVPLGEQSYSPPEISAMILRTLKARAEAALGAGIRRAVITVPAYFSDAQRQATRDAGEIAGLEVVRILNEPTAAALAYGVDRERDRTVLVYDLGGGTFDASLVDIHSEVTEVLASHGDTHLGGDDFDQLLLDWILRRFSETGGPDLHQDRRAISRLLHASEEAKRRLSFEPYARVLEEHIAERDGVPVHLDLDVPRDDYERLIRHWIDRTLDSVHQTLADASKRPDQVDEILLVGGATRTPIVSELLTETFGFRPRQDVHPDLCVALGAGVLAARLTGHDVERVLVDVTPYSFGISYVGMLDDVPSDNCYRPIIFRNAPLPTSQTEPYGTVLDDQEAVEVSIYQGDDPYALNNILVGRFRAGGLSRAPAGNEILVRMDLDLNGILRVAATEKRTGLSKQITIEGATTALSQGEIANAQRRVAKLFGDGPAAATGETAPPPPERRTDQASADADRERRVAVSEARALLERSGKLLETMNADDREEAIGLNEQIQNALSAADWDRLRSVTNTLADLLFYVGET